MITLRTTDYAKISESDDKPEIIRTILDDAAKQIKNAHNPAVFVSSPAQKGEEIVLYDKNMDQVQQFIGILYYKDAKEEYLLQIHSRFDNNEGNFFFKYLIEKTFGEGVYFLGNDLFPEGNILALEQLLAVVFMRRIHQAFKKGVYRKYRTYERNDPKAKGTIDVARHIRLNPKFNGNIAYSYRELTADNEVNRLIFSTYKMMEKKYPWLKSTLHHDQNVRDYVSQMDQIMTSASRAEIRSLIKKGKQKVTNPLYREWDRVRQVAIMIQRHMDNFKGEPGEGHSVGFLVDMNRAWEIYLEKIFDKNARAQNAEFILNPAKSQNSGKIPNSALMNRTIRPDFCWYSEKGEKREYNLVLDAKNKLFWDEVLKCDDEEGSDQSKINKIKSGTRADIYQIFSYMLALNCNVGGVVCPAESDKDEIQQRAYDISNYTNEETFYVLGLPVGFSKKTDTRDKSPVDEYAAYKEYAEEMRQREDKLKQIVDDLFSW